jgi:hypothetical protein
VTTTVAAVPIEKTPAEGSTTVERPESPSARRQFRESDRAARLHKDMRVTMMHIAEGTGNGGAPISLPCPSDNGPAQLWMIGSTSGPPHRVG